MKIFSASLASVRKIFIDTFNRPNQTGLKIASDGSVWTNLRGSFDIVSNKAQTSTTDYPTATVKMPTKNNEISLFGISQGAAASIWVTDAGNWWSVGVFQQEEACNCQTCFNCEAYSGSNCAAYSVESYNTINYGVIGYNPTNYGITSYNPANYGVTSYNAANYGLIGYFGANYGITGGQNARYGTTGGENALNYGITGGRNARYAKYSTNTWAISGYNAANYGVTGGGNPKTGIIGYNAANYGITGGQNPRNGVVGGENARNGIVGGQNAINGAIGGDNPRYGYASGGNPNNVCSATNPNECLSQFAYDCNCQVCYPQYIRILQSVGSTVSTVYSWLIGTVTSSTLAQSLKVITNNNEITVKAYSDPSLVSQIGSDLIYTPTGAAVTTTFGISITPSTYNQGYSIDKIEIKRKDL